MSSILRDLKVEVEKEKDILEELWHDNDGLNEFGSAAEQGAKAKVLFPLFRNN